MDIDVVGVCADTSDADAKFETGKMVVSTAVSVPALVPVGLWREAAI